MTRSNIKNLPSDREYFTEVGYSQTYPWVVVSRTEKTITLAPVNTDKDPEWLAKMKWQPGGFAGHCSNQSEQTWLFAGFGEGRRVIRKTKRGWSYKGVTYRENQAIEFYDYNF